MRNWPYLTGTNAEHNCRRHLTCSRSWPVLLALCVLAVLALRFPAPPQPVHKDTGDLALYEDVAAKLAQQQPYYVVMGTALRERGYPTRSVFNWRTPLLLTAIASVPTAVSRGVQVGLGVLLLTMTLLVFKREAHAPTWTAVILQASALTMSAAAFFFGESWAGVLIGCSVCASVLRRPALAVLFGAAALFVRELAAPYCVVAVVLAVSLKHWRVVAGWMLAGSLYAGYYGRHVAQVLAHRLPTDIAHHGSWVNFDGLPALMGKVGFTGLLALTPPALTVSALVLIVAGIASTRTPAIIRLTSIVYVAFFLVAGQSFDTYWGMVAWPTWSLACGYGAAELADLIRSFVPLRRFPPTRSVPPLPGVEPA